MITKEFIAESYQKIQDEITVALEKLDGKAKFEEEIWNREGGGGGRTRIIQNGNILKIFAIDLKIKLKSGTKRHLIF